MQSGIELHTAAADRVTLSLKAETLDLIENVNMRVNQSHEYAPFCVAGLLCSKNLLRDSICIKLEEVQQFWQCACCAKCLQTQT